MPCCASSSGSNGKMHSTWSQLRAELFDALGAPGPDRRADEVHRLDAALRAGRASSSRLKSGASTPMNSVGRARASSRSRSCVADAHDLAVVAQHLDIAAHGQLLAAATRPRSRARAICGAADALRLQLRASAPACRRAAGRPAGRRTPRRRPCAKRGAGQSHAASARDAARGSRARKAAISATSAAASGVLCASAAIAARAVVQRAAFAVQQLVHLP